MGSLRVPDGPQGQWNLSEALANLRRMAVTQWMSLSVSNERVKSRNISGLTRNFLYAHQFSTPRRMRCVISDIVESTLPQTSTSIIRIAFSEHPLLAVSQKCATLSLFIIFAKYQPIFKILLLAHSAYNLQ